MMFIMKWTGDCQIEADNLEQAVESTLCLTLQKRRTPSRIARGAANLWTSR